MEKYDQISREEAIYVESLVCEMKKQHDKDRSVRDNMLAFCMSRLSNISQEEAEVEVDKLIKGIASFTNNLEDLEQRGEEAIMQRLDEATVNLSLEQKQKFLLDFLLALKISDAKAMEAYLGDTEHDAVKVLEEFKMSNLDNAENELTEDGVNELMVQAKEALSNSAIGVTGTQNMLDLLDDLPRGEGAMVNYVEQSWNIMDLKHYTAVATYVAYKEGELPSIPENTDAEIIGMSVAAGIERDHVIREAARGNIAWEVAKTTLKYIGAALLIGLAGWLAIKIALGSMMLGLFVVADVFAMATWSMFVVLPLAGYLGYRCASFVIDTVIDALPIVEKAYEKVMDYVHETVIPAVKKGIKKVVNFFKKLIGIDEKNTDLEVVYI